MPATYTDQFFVIDPGNPPARNTPLTVVKLNYIDQDDNNWISPSGDDSIGGLDVTSVWVGDTIRVIMDGQRITITGVTFYLAGGETVFTPTDGTILTDAIFIRSTFVNTSTQVPVSSFGPPCFVRGTMILTPDGERLVENLDVGDLVVTRDGGAKPIRWTGRRQVSGLDKHAPVCFAPGALGNERQLVVSPQHRILISGWRAELLMGCDEVLVAAKDMLRGDMIYRKPIRAVEYFHLMFDRHEIILADGIATESFFPGDTILEGDDTLRSELTELFPELGCPQGSDYWETARPVAHRIEAQAMMVA